MELELKPSGVEVGVETSVVGLSPELQYCSKIELLIFKDLQSRNSVDCVLIFN